VNNSPRLPAMHFGRQEKYEHCTEARAFRLRQFASFVLFVAIFFI
jgi:hypothetical protein